MPSAQAPSGAWLRTEQRFRYDWRRGRVQLRTGPAIPGRGGTLHDGRIHNDPRGQQCLRRVLFSVRYAGTSDGRDMNEPVASVVVPTFNRVEFLPRVLHSLLRQTLDRSSYEIIVVDNNSTDTTRDVVDRVAREHPAVRYALELEQGVSHAKNAGLRAARGGIVAYIDDDAVASRDWLKILVESFEHVRPAPHVVGGPVLPLFLGRRPVWYRDSYSAFSWGEVPRLLGRHECFYGANVAFRREMLLAVGGFDTRLGMKGTNLAMEEDVEVFERLWESCGKRLWAYYAPGAQVLHLIPVARMNPLYRLRRGFANGQTIYVRECAPSGRGGFGRWSYAAAKFAQVFLSAGARALGLPHYGRWMIEWGVPVAERLGYLAAASGVRVSIRRSH